MEDKLSQVLTLQGRLALKQLALDSKRDGITAGCVHAWHWVFIQRAYCPTSETRTFPVLSII
jgi:hypothetical protein